MIDKQTAIEQGKKLVELVANEDWRAIGRVVDFLRANGCNYNDVRDIACNATGLEPNAWETILYQVDEAESQDEHEDDGDDV